MFLLLSNLFTSYALVIETDDNTTTLFNDEGEFLLSLSVGNEELSDIEEIQPMIYRFIAWKQNAERVALYNCATGKFTDFIYRQAYGGDSDDSLILVLDNDAEHFGYIDTSFETVIPFIYFDAQPFSCGLAWVELENGQKGFIDENGNYVICPSPTIWDYAYGFSEGFAVVSPKGKEQYGYINTEGTLIVLPQYDRAEDFHNGFARVIKDEQYYYLTQSGDVLGNRHYEKARDFSFSYAAVSNNGKWGFIDDLGNIIIDPIYKCVLDADIYHHAWVLDEMGQWQVLDLQTGQILSQ